MGQGGPSGPYQGEVTPRSFGSKRAAETCPQRRQLHRKRPCGPHPKIAPPEQRHEHTTTIHGRRPNDPRQHARQRRAGRSRCGQCHHEAVLNANRWPEHMPGRGVWAAHGPRVRRPGGKHTGQHVAVWSWRRTQPLHRHRGDPEPERNCCSTTAFSDSRPQCTDMFEKSRLSWPVCWLCQQ